MEISELLATETVERDAVALEALAVPFAVELLPQFRAEEPVTVVSGSALVNICQSKKQLDFSR